MNDTGLYDENETTSPSARIRGTRSRPGRAEGRPSGYHEPLDRREIRGRWGLHHVDDTP